jgi:hypothetical protein
MIVPTLCVGTPSEDAPRPVLDLRQRFVDVLDLALIDAERRGLHSHAERGNDQERCKALLNRGLSPITPICGRDLLTCWIWH